MKTRKSFVANSSSSSFVCEICGDSEVYYDSVSDVGGCYCVNGHCICEEHLLNDDELSDEEQDNADYSNSKPASSCPICTFQCYSEPEMVQYLKKIYGVSEQEVFEEIKKLNKRRKRLYDGEYIKEVFNRHCLTEDIIMNDIRSKFNSHEEFSNFYRSN